ncbi:MAG: cytochrome c biogenesis protein CcsA [Verrucomicrobiota bacterium]
MKRHLPWIITGVFALWFLSTLRAPKPGEFQIEQLAELPVVFNGRHQPLDSVARNSLVQIRDRYTVRTPMSASELAARSPVATSLGITNRTLSAAEWLAEVMMRPSAADDRKAFRIDHPGVISLLKLPEKNDSTGEDGKHYSWNQLSPGFKEIEDQAKQILTTKKEESQRDAFDRAILKLRNALTLYMRLKNTVRPQDTVNFTSELAAFDAGLPAGVAAVRNQQNGQPYDTNAFNNLLGLVTRYNVTAEMEPPLIIPPHHPERDRDGWSRMGEVLMAHVRGEALPPSVAAWARMSDAFQSGNGPDFVKSVEDYRRSLPAGLQAELTKGHRETFFNRMAPFYDALVIYVAAFLFAIFYWFHFAEWSRRTAFALIGLAFVIHSTGLIFRMVLEGRPPVTNLYSSAIFIGWGAVVLGMVLEKFWRNAIGLVVASSLGFVTLIIAHNLALGGDTMVMLQAVLDTNFWLATHVVIVTLGYASTYVAGFLAVVYILRGVLTRGLDEATGRALARMVYGIICFATLFSFIGTILGGIWADQSWGRFWGWDPKENGALIIVLWNALLLHARWGGIVRERGLMNLTVVGNIVTSWSWFGTNMLGIGLHAYGFMSGAFLWLGVFILSQLTIIGLGLLPDRYWRSRNGVTVTRTPASPGPRHVPAAAGAR